MRKMISMLISLILIIGLVGCESGESVSKSEMNLLNTKMKEMLSESYEDPLITNKVIDLKGLNAGTTDEDRMTFGKDKIVKVYLDTLFGDINDNSKKTNIFTKTKDGLVLGVAYKYERDNMSIYGMCVYDINDESLDMCIRNDFVQNVDKLMNKITPNQSNETQPETEKEETVTKEIETNNEEPKQKVKNNKFYIGNDGLYHCSKCDRVPRKEEYNNDYCPNCDGEKEESEEEMGQCYDCGEWKPVSEMTFNGRSYHCGCVDNMMSVEEGYESLCNWVKSNIGEDMQCYSELTAQGPYQVTAEVLYPDGSSWGYATIDLRTGNCWTE